MPPSELKLEDVLEVPVDQPFHFTAKKTAETLSKRLFQVYKTDRFHLLLSITFLIFSVDVLIKNEKLIYHFLKNLSPY